MGARVEYEWRIEVCALPGHPEAAPGDIIDSDGAESYADALRAKGWREGADECTRIDIALVRDDLHAARFARSWAYVRPRKDGRGMYLAGMFRDAHERIGKAVPARFLREVERANNGA